MRVLFLLNEVPYPEHRNGVALINYHLVTRAPAGIRVDMLVSEDENPEGEMGLRAAAANLGTVTYGGKFRERLFRISNLVAGAFIGRYVLQLGVASSYLRDRGSEYDAVYIAPMMSYVDPGGLDKVFLNAVDSFARFNDIAHQKSGRFRDWIKCWLYRRYEMRMLGTVSLVNFVSAADMAYVHGLNSKAALCCVPNGVDTDYFIPGGKEREQHSLLFTGNFSYAPNKDAARYLVNEILPPLRTSQPSTRVYIVGRDPPADLIGIDGVVVTGFVDDIRDYYQRCSVFVCPLLSGAGIKNKVLEALSCGIPVVTTPLGAEGIEGLSAGEHYLVANDPREFLERVLSLWGDPFSAERMVKAARGVVVARMNWAEVAAKYFSLLSDIARKDFGGELELEKPESLANGGR